MQKWSGWAQVPLKFRQVLLTAPTDTVLGPGNAPRGGADPRGSLSSQEEGQEGFQLQTRFCCPHWEGHDSGLSFPRRHSLGCSVRRLMAWLLHRLEMALPQPVLHQKAGDQVSVGDWGGSERGLKAWVKVGC